jgi:hypothetical protein
MEAACCSLPDCTVSQPRTLQHARPRTVTMATAEVSHGQCLQWRHRTREAAAAVKGTAVSRQHRLRTWSVRVCRALKRSGREYVGNSLQAVCHLATLCKKLIQLVIFRHFRFEKSVAPPSYPAVWERDALACDQSRPRIQPRSHAARGLHSPGELRRNRPPLPAFATSLRRIQ